MVDVLVIGFLVLHGLLHLVVWLPKPDPDAEKPPPFHPDHSTVLTAVAAPQATTHRVSIALAVAATVGYVMAGLVLAFGASWAAVALTIAAGLGLLLKGLFFHPWLSVGVLLDILVLSSALVGWPVSVP
jgi:hypothetical protein